MVMEEEQFHMDLASESVPVPSVQNLNEQPMEETEERFRISNKKPRQRKKALHAAILKQMEFYFSDANLCKDRYLGQLIKQDPYVDLDEFLRFNKIRALTTDASQIVKALQKSTTLSVSEDGTRICRVTPICQKENSEDCTVYVQRLPIDADHEWLTGVFARYGPVEYVSIPRYKWNKRIKGFAFVEFEKPESAEECIKAFREKGYVLPSQTSPDELQSITTFLEEEQMEKRADTERTGGQDIVDTILTDETARNSGESEFLQSEDIEREQQEKKHSETKHKGTDEEGEFQETKKMKKRKQKESESIDEEKIDGIECDCEAKSQTKAKKRKHRDSKHESDAEVSKTKGTDEFQGTVDNELQDVEEKSKEQRTRGSEMIVSGKRKGNEIVIESSRKSKKQKQKSAESVEEKSDESTGSSNKRNEDESDLDKKEKSKKKKTKHTVSLKTIDGSHVSYDEKTESDMVKNENLQTESGNDDVKDDISETREILEEDKRKKRKRKRQSRSEKLDAADIGLEIMAKKDWKRLRNKYLELQRNKMKSLKQHLKRARWSQWNSHDKYKDSDKSKAAREENNEKEGKKEETSTERFVFTPGVIVKIEMDEPCTDPRSFKMELKGNTSIKYIDVREGSNQAFIRCDNAEAAKAMTQQSNEEKSITILQDAEEKDYWMKMSRDREEKLCKKNRVGKQRGRQKLLKKAEKELGKHIKFDEV